VTVFLVTAVWGKPGRAFCARGECRCRPVTVSVCSVALLVSSASAASAAREVPAVTLDWIIEQTACCRAAVKDTWPVVTGPLSWRRRSARAAAASAVRDAAALARTSWVAVIQAQNSEDALKATHAEILQQRTRIGELIGQIRDLQAEWTEGSIQRITTENTTLKQRVRQLTTDNRTLDERLKAARSNMRFQDRRLADLETQIAGPAPGT
jgi:hypothetical protein